MAKIRKRPTSKALNTKVNFSRSVDNVFVVNRLSVYLGNPCQCHHQVRAAVLTVDNLQSALDKIVKEALDRPTAARAKLKDEY